MVVVSVLEFIYRRPMGIIGNRATGKMLALGLILMLAPLWSFLWKRIQHR